MWIESLLLSSLEKCKSLSQLNQIHALLTISGLANVFHYNAIIRAFSSTKNPYKSVSTFISMLRNDVVPNHLTYPFLAKASARILNLKLAGSVHGLVFRTGYASDMFVSNSLVHMYGSCRDIVSARKVFDEMPMKNSVSWNSVLDAYAKCGDVNLMRKVFDLMPRRDVISWSSLIDGYVKDGNYVEALAVFAKMGVDGVKANDVTMVSVLCACSHLGTLEQGRMMHNHIIENGLHLTLTLRTSLVDMYAKCGAIDEALAVFRAVSVRKTDVLIWNAMIGGLATHGFTQEALEMNVEMQDLGIRPDEITYLCLLSACAHRGLVKEAWKYFKSISQNSMEPKTEHYACIVDVLARAGQLKEAHEFIQDMMLKPTASMLGALLSGCINHRKLDIAEAVGKMLIELEPDHDGRYIGLSNVYAVKNCWDESRTMREAMETRGVRKVAGYSYVEILGTLHRFIAHDQAHPQSEQIDLMLDLIVKQMKMKSDCERRRQVFLDMDNM
ncbi:pentatricopeptide repeat-containing At5g08305 [Olea europaea subsp. europaea]|uniref:Pentatricopeptide repeat-containing At5g08305 n=1 Tax=Olea europaea subsp. europaea TaxID=158383 RepID=A0A8S0QCL3_OLEEU|nr:pentatricopeptide repeat-containing At5g08305 [Olea europaea subsp. europaea]